EGVDNLTGGLGDDWLRGGAGNDTIDGGDNGAEGDTVSYFDAENSVTVDLSGSATGDGTATSTAGTNAAGIGDDILIGIENIEGSDFDDLFIGDAGANFIDGDYGNDTITGGAGNDTLTGGGGSDTFIYQSGDSGVDIIKDFQGYDGGDVLDLTLLTGSQNGDTIGNIVNLLDDGTNTTVQVDADGSLNGQTYVDVVTLEGETGLDLTTMEDDGNIVWTAT
ncbi:MAG: calcium-binding protein, partial [Phycisphaerae bacterium]|nr:calcium-binding protein [Phycisphaerae bacterium]